MDENKLSGVFVAHHKDDIIENIFTNSMKGGNLLDIEVMKKKSKISGVNIYRPLLDHHKDIIYDFAHKYHIPYFIDTTPTWSRRGKMRNEIFPLLDSVFSPSWRLKLKNIGDQSNEWGEYINNYVINPWVNKIVFGKHGFIMPIQDQPKLIYNIVIMKAMHSMGKHMLKNTSVNKIMDSLTIKNKLVNLDNGYHYFSDNDNNFIIFNKNEIQNKFNNINLTSEPLYENSILNFLSGNISYQQPYFVSKTYNVNKKIYTAMNIKLPIDLLTTFDFICQEYKNNQYLNTS